jgi:hypothetical protein
MTPQVVDVMLNGSFGKSFYYAPVTSHHLDRAASACL